MSKVYSVEVVEFDVLYFKPDNNGRGPGRVFSHKYRERWQHIQMYCPNCGKRAVWQEDSTGDYYFGERYLCLTCEHSWTIQGPYPPHPSDEQGSQRIKKISVLARSEE